MSMTYDHAGHQRFSGAVNQFDVNHQPPRKEAAMKKLTLKHVSAISHAEMFIHPAIRQSMTPRQREEIEKDLVRLAEVKRFILKAMYEPGLPVKTEIPEEG